MTDTPSDRQVNAVRRFNRFYTRQIGALNETLVRSAFSLTEVRVLYELAHREQPTAAELGRALGLDAGYLSRMLRNFRKRGLVATQPSGADGRQSLLALTDRGRAEFATLDTRSHADVRAMLRTLSGAERNGLVDAMGTIVGLLGQEPPAADTRQAPYLLRPHRPGDMGWIVHRHGALYWQEYGWDERFEALVAGIVARFVTQFDPVHERCWIAERDGEIVGSVFLVRKSKTVAKLRLLLVEPKARGLGLGRRLVAECVRFARDAGYRKVTLWTNSVLHAARHLYEEAGFVLVHEEPHESYGHELVAQTWELTL